MPAVAERDAGGEFAARWEVFCAWAQARLAQFRARYPH